MKKNRLCQIAVHLLAIFGLMLAAGSSAFADEIFYLTVQEHGCTTCAPADTVQVDVDLLTSGTGTSTATVTFTAENVGGTQYALYAAELNVVGTFGISEYVVTGGSAAGTFTPPPTIAVSSGPLDSYGTFSEASGTGVTNSVETLHDASSVEFYLDDGTWSTAASVLTPTTTYNTGDYSQGFDAAAQVRVNDCTSSSEPGCTGNTGTNGSTMDTAGFPTSAVPEPSSVVLFSTVVLGLVGLTRKRLSAR